MDAPYSQTQMPLAAPLSEMPDIVVGALTSNQFTNFNYSESPYRIQASRAEHETWGGRRFTKSFSLEIIWQEDTNPPAQFIELKANNEVLDPLIVTIKLKYLQSQDQTQAKQKLTALWQDIKEKLKQCCEALPLRKPCTDHGTARFATRAELDEEGYFSEHASEDLSTRFNIGSINGRALSVPRRYTEAHTIVAGPPGVGKSRTIMIPNLIERINTSAIVTEVTAGEDIVPTVYGATAGFRKAKGHQVYYFNPSDLASSTRFNPIDFINNVGDAIKFANLIMANTTAKNHFGDQIWVQAETHLLTGLLLYAWGLGGKKKSVEGGKSNLGYIRHILRLGPLELQTLIEQTGIPEARVRFTEFIKNSSPNFRLGVFSGLIQRLNPWLDPVICELTEVTDFDPIDLREKLFTFYLAYPVHRQEFKPVMALAINFLINLPLTKSFAKPLTMFLDEFAAYGYIPGIDNLQATIRNRGIGMVFGFQDQQQLTKIYSSHEAEVIFSNTDTKIIFATGSPKAQQQISAMLGTTTKEKKQISSSGQIYRQAFGQPLLSPSEVGRIPEGKVLVIRNKRNPILADTVSPAKYNSLSEQYPPPKPVARRVKTETIKQCESAKKLQFDETFVEPDPANATESNVIERNKNFQEGKNTPEHVANEIDPTEPNAGFYILDGQDPNAGYWQ